MLVATVRERHPTRRSEAFENLGSLIFSLLVTVEVAKTEAARLWLRFSGSDDARGCEGGVESSGVWLWFSDADFLSTPLSGRTARSGRGGECSFSGES